ncbi:MAG: hypothetical protein WCB68_12720 [Pyrinomonadaceae bacterium]
MSAIVIQELAAGAMGKSALQELNALRHEYEGQGRLLIPTGEDWWLAGKVLNSLLRGLKSQRGGLTPKLHPAEKHRIVRDVLIARTARRAGALLVTDNAKDFEMIRRFCSVRTVRGAEYFRRKRD